MRWMHTNKKKVNMNTKFLEREDIPPRTRQGESGQEFFP